MYDKGKVPGHGPWQGAASPKLEKPPSSQDGGPALQELWGDPHGDVALVSSSRRSLYHQSGKSWSSFAWCSLVDCFIHGNGNCDAGVTARWRARDSAEGAEPMCALPRRQIWLREEGNSPGLKGFARLEGASPGLKGPRQA